MAPWRRQTLALQHLCGVCVEFLNRFHVCSITWLCWQAGELAAVIKTLHKEQGHARALKVVQQEVDNSCCPLPRAMHLLLCDLLLLCDSGVVHRSADCVGPARWTARSACSTRTALVRYDSQSLPG